MMRDRIVRYFLQLAPRGIVYFMLSISCVAHSADSMLIGIGPEENAPVPDNASNLIVIMHPSDKSTVFNNSGNLQVQVAVAPRLLINPDNRIELFLDGQLAARQIEKKFTLHSIVRGSHRLRVRIVDVQDKTIDVSNAVTFYMWHASRNFPSRR